MNRNPERSVTSGTDGKLVSWRRLATEAEETQYNVYQNGTLLATTKNTNLKLSKLNNNDVFRVVPVIDGKELTSGIGEFKYTTTKQPYSNTFMMAMANTTISLVRCRAIMTNLLIRFRHIRLMEHICGQ